MLIRAAILLQLQRALTRRQPRTLGRPPRMTRVRSHFILAIQIVAAIVRAALRLAE